MRRREQELNMTNAHYIANQWLASTSLEDIPVIDPSTGDTYSSIARGTAADIEAAISAARLHSAKPSTPVGPVVCRGAQPFAGQARRGGAGTS